MREGGSLSNQWTLIEQNANVSAADFYAPLEGLDPNDDQHVMICFGGSYTESGQQNAPYREYIFLNILIFIIPSFTSLYSPRLPLLSP